jgi:hypothetical protein
MIRELLGLFIVAVQLFLHAAGLLIVVLLGLSLLPKENWRTLDKWAAECDAGDTHRMNQQEAATCTARLLARNK